MKVKLLIATGDADYSEHLSDNISQQHSDVFEVSVCGTPERMKEMLSSQRFDLALLEGSFARQADLHSVQLPLLLSEGRDDPADVPGDIIRINKYQRISSMVSALLEHFAKASVDKCARASDKAYITAVWSPAGGVGKTAVALACAECEATNGKRVLYLNLEPFSSVPVYFGERGKSISSVFEMLESNEGDVKMLIQSIRRRDNGGVSYFGGPDNFDDMNILTAENIAVLIDDSSQVTDELVIDMSCACDERNRVVFELADRILLVTDATPTAQAKLSQFVTQNNVFRRIVDKSCLVANKGASVRKPPTGVVIRLPFVQSSDPSTVYKTMAGCWEPEVSI